METTRRNLSFGEKLKAESVARKMRENITHMRLKAAQLLAHPEATPEQIQEARRMLMDVERSAREVTPLLLKHHIDPLC